MFCGVRLRCAAVAALAAVEPEQCNGHHQKRGREHIKDLAPAEPLGHRAAERRTQDLAADAESDEPRERRLAVLVGGVIADPGNRDRNDAGRADARDEAQHGQPRQGRRQRRAERADAGNQHRYGYGSEPAHAITEWTVDYLKQSVRKRERRDDDGRHGWGNPEVFGQSGQQRIEHAQVRARNERGAREERERGDRATGRQPVACVSAFVRRATVPSTSPSLSSPKSPMRNAR